MRFALLLTALTACVGSNLGNDETHLTGTEESAVTNANGEQTCDHGKVLICHIPPGNPENAHTICVGAPAVRAHAERHGDPVGACEPDDDVPPPDDDVPPPDDDVPPPDGDVNVIL